MNGVQIGWDENSPSGTESMNSGDDRMRSLKTAMRSGLDDEHNFPAAGGANVGYHRYGSTRAFYGTQSQVSSGGTDGRLMVTSDTSRLFVAGSASTLLLGGYNMLSGATGGWVVPPQRAYWALEVGGIDSTVLTGGDGYASITFPNSGYSGRPVVIVSAAGGGEGRPCDLSAFSITKTDFVAYSSDFTAGTFVSGITFNWMSYGTRTL